MPLALIVAVSENGIIGRAGELPWRLSADLRRFKRLTMGHPIIMGRKTYESIGRPLPGRQSVVITRDETYRAEGVTTVTSLAQAIDIVTDQPAFVIGGRQIYALALPRVQRIYWTTVHAEIDGDTTFPDSEIDWSCWRLVEDERFAADDRNEWDYSFRVFERAPTASDASLNPSGSVDGKRDHIVDRRGAQT